MIELSLFNAFLVITIGFLAGLGWHVSDQVIWFVCDLIKEKYDIPLG